MLILLVLFVSIFLHKMTRGKADITYIVLVSLVFFSAFFDVSRVSIARYASHSIYSLISFRIICTIYLFMRNITTPCFILYVYLISGQWKGISNSKKFFIPWLIFTSLITIICFLGFFTNAVFEISPDLVYKRGPLLYSLFGLAGFGFFYALVSILNSKGILDKERKLNLYGVIFISLCGVIVQIISPVFNVEILCTAMPLLFIFLLIQRPVENIDEVSRCLNYYAFTKFLEKTDILNDEVTVILIKITNESFIKKHLTDTAIQKLINLISDNLYKLKSSSETELYYLNTFTYAIVTYTNDINKIDSFAQKCSKYLKELKRINQIPVRTRFKMCVVNYPTDIKTATELISFTNTFTDCLNHSNCVCYFNQEAKSQDFIIKYELNDIINHAITENKFEMFYQPIYNVHTGKIESAEALIRLKDEKFGFIPPGLFIPAAENSGAIHTIGEYVIKDVFKFISEYNISSLGLKYIELNLSISQCVEVNLVSKILNYMNEYQITSGQINLELTESMENFDSEIFYKNIANLKLHGIELSLDDFGTGYSNIERLLRIPVGIIKFDKAFADKYQNEKMAIIIKETIDMLHKIDKKVLIEGIEDNAAFESFKNFGVDYVQGYYFSKPLPELDFIRYIKYYNGGENESV